MERQHADACSYLLLLIANLAEKGVGPATLCLLDFSTQMKLTRCKYLLHPAGLSAYFKLALGLQVETSLARAADSGGAPGNGPAPSLLIQQALEAIARISKGFNANLCTRVRPEIGEHLLWYTSHHSNFCCVK